MCTVAHVCTDIGCASADVLHSRAYEYEDRVREGNYVCQHVCSHACAGGRLENAALAYTQLSFVLRVQAHNGPSAYVL
eukprot:6188114-Pleurochrysis_carterae.AAC.3